MNLGRYEEANGALEQALVYDPENAVAKEILGTINQKLHQKPTQNIQSGSQSFNPCNGNTKCGDECCASDEGCCQTKYGQVCYNPQTHVCRNGDLQTVWGESVLPHNYGMGVPGSSNQPKENENTGTQ